MNIDIDMEKSKPLYIRVYECIYCCNLIKGY